MNNNLNFLEELFLTIEKKAKSKDKNSYTKELLKKGKKTIAQKIGEESSELIIDYLSGTKNGFDLELLKKSTDILKIPIIASGGVGKLEHFEEGVLKGGASALLAASVFHFNEFSIKDVKKFLKKKKISVRL